jgi:phosphoglycolate phosphatase-like HAD superfamily hydrolase
MRLCLFDVDGTLILTKGAGRRAMGQALLDTYGASGPFETYDMRGRTDLEIVRDLMTVAGVPEQIVAERLGQFFSRYAEVLRAEIAAGSGVELLPGVPELLSLLNERPTAMVGLLTGNLEVGARIKLDPTGLLPYFKVGAYGSDDADRTKLPEVAARRAEALLGEPVHPRQVVVIGDTPLDIHCARVFGARAVAVATGFYKLEELAAHCPDALFTDLSDVPRVLATLLDGSSEAEDG